MHTYTAKFDDRVEHYGHKLPDMTHAWTIYAGGKPYVHGIAKYRDAAVRALTVHRRSIDRKKTGPLTAQIVEVARA